MPRTEQLALLVQVLELQADAEDAATEEEVRRLRGENAERRAAAVAGLQDAFARGDTVAAEQLVQKLTYWHRIESLLSSKLCMQGK